MNFNTKSNNWIDTKTNTIYPSTKIGDVWEVKVPSGNRYHLLSTIKELGHDLGDVEGSIWVPNPLPFQSYSRIYMGDLPLYRITLSGGVELTGHGTLDLLEIRIPLINLPDQIFHIKTQPLARIRGIENEEDLMIIYRYKNVPIHGKIEYQIIYDFIPITYSLPHYWGNIQHIPHILRQRYTQILRNWHLPEKIQVQLNALIRPVLHEDLSVIYRELYTFVRFAIKPSNQSIRKGTRELFRQEEELVGDCDEYTDLFIACARFLGLPARRVTGFFYEPNSENRLRTDQELDKEIERHAWVEVYAPLLEHWVIIDVAQLYFGLTSIHHLPTKLEGTSDSRQDMKIYTKHSQAIDFQYESYFNDPQIEIIKNITEIS